MKKRVLIFGLGYNYLRDREDLLEKYDVVKLVDNDKCKQGTLIDDIEVIEPLKLLDYEFDKIIITPNKPLCDQIYNQLIKMDIPKNKINFNKSPKTFSMPPFLIDPAFFSELNYEEKKKLFAQNVELVYLEVSSQCNRRCWFCPNASIDRHSNMNKMNQDTFEKVVRELSEIDYNGDVSFSVYNEPLMDEDLETKIRFVKKMLPNAMLHFNTNGDFLTEERLAKLEKAGLDRILISMYTQENAKTNWDYEKVYNQITKKSQSLGLVPKFYTTNNNVNCMSSIKYGSLTVIMHSQNFHELALDRAGELSKDLPIPKIEKRDKVCLSIYLSFVVNYLGNVLPCVSFHPDSENHKEFTIGDANKENIFDIFAGEKFTQYRKKLLCDINTKPCNSCTSYAESGLLNPPGTKFRNRPRFRK